VELASSEEIGRRPARAGQRWTWHLVRRMCGSVVDLELEDRERAVHATARTIRRESGFEVSAHRIDFFGTCTTCAPSGG
jgi:Fe2+ or Zn2+ uptake regulation protein